MFQVIALLQRRTDLDAAAFRKYWTENHPSFARELPGLRRYTQTELSVGDFDGVGQLWFDDETAYRAAARSPAMRALRADEKNFIGRIEWFAGPERVVPLAVDPHPGRIG
jgi:uncharacterized protein (TIGR02118 family)